MFQPTGRFTYLYDPDKRIARLVNPEGNITSWSYDAASRVTAYRMANGTRASYTCDKADRVLCLANLGPGGFGILREPMSLGNLTRHLKMALTSLWLFCVLNGLLSVVFFVDRIAWFKFKMIIASNTGKLQLILFESLLVLSGLLRRKGGGA
jgi:YD repeat-containing protein